MNLHGTLQIRDYSLGAKRVFTIQVISPFQRICPSLYLFIPSFSTLLPNLILHRQPFLTECPMPLTLLTVSSSHPPDHDHSLLLLLPQSTRPTLHYFLPLSFKIILLFYSLPTHLFSSNKSLPF